ncbi:MAG: hypothetical protein ACXVHU_04210 [Methanobacterium sp.]
MNDKINLKIPSKEDIKIALNKTSMTNAGVDDLRSRKLMGQKGMDIGTTYDDPKGKTLKKTISED